jgi:hypothetical protein
MVDKLKGVGESLKETVSVQREKVQHKRQEVKKTIGTVLSPPSPPPLFMLN